MCTDGVQSFLGDLAGRDLESLGANSWETLRDGFGQPKRGGKDSPQLHVGRCPRCFGKLPIVQRALVSSAYNLPDVAVYQRLTLGAPTIAMGIMTNDTTRSRRPSIDVLGRWQAMMWRVYQVTFVTVEGGRIEPFAPAQGWGIGAPWDDLARIAEATGQALRDARRAGRIPRLKSNREGDSNATRDEIERVLSPVLSERFGLDYRGMEAEIAAVYWGRRVDLLYGRRRTSETLAIEVKVDEDWDHPVNQPLGDLLAHSAVLNVRVPAKRPPLDAPTLRLVEESEHLLEASGRARFLTVG